MFNTLKRDIQAALDRDPAARNTLDRPGFGLTRHGHEILVGIPEIVGPSGQVIPVRQVGAMIAGSTGILT